MKSTHFVALAAGLSALGISLWHRHHPEEPGGVAGAVSVRAPDSPVSAGPMADPGGEPAAPATRPEPAQAPSLASSPVVIPPAAPAPQAFRYPDEPPPAKPGLTPEERAALVTSLTAKSTAEQAAAKAWATQRGLPVKGNYPEGGGWELMSLDENGQPLYNTTHNVNAAISNGVRPRMVDTGVRGQGMTAGIWDQDLARTTHLEFLDVAGGFRVTPGDRGAGPVFTNLVFSSHATHVTGTVVGGGFNLLATGMAPLARALTYDWNGDTGELTGVGATYSGEPGRIYVSNHSYGAISGWSFITHTTTNPAPAGVTGNYWYGTDGQAEDWKFGAYDSSAGAWDTICRQLPYLLPFRAAGNDRGDSSGATNFVFRAGAWTRITTGLPQADGGTTGYDTVSTNKVAKNIMTVGAVDDAVASGARSPSSAAMSSFSGWGPADDGRIKPDIVANGVDLLSADFQHDIAYSTKSGTSMATPSATGAALLLQQWQSQNRGHFLTAASLKALIIHTATDLDPPGPDYRNGWGLMNTEAAHDHLILNANFPEGRHIWESELNANVPSQRLSFTAPAGSVIKATLVWADPAGPTSSALDDRTPDLVNDLDLTLIHSGLTAYGRAAQLDPLNPANAATYTGNIRDNVEQCVMFSVNGTGVHELVINHKGTLQGGPQRFSLMLHGNASPSTGTLADGFDQPETTRGFTTSRDLGWAWQSSAGFTGNDRIVSLPLADSSTSAVETKLTGGSTVRFRWGVSSEANYDKLRFLVDGVLISEISGEVATTTFIHAITGASQHTLRWEYVKDVNTAAGQDRGWLDDLQFDSLAEAVDQPLLAFVNVPGSAVNFAIDTPGPNDFARCSGLPVNSFSSFETTIAGPAVIAFVMSRTGSYGDLYCTYGPNLGRAASSTQSGGAVERFQIEVGPGPQLVRWTFSKGNPGAGASDGSGIVDAIQILPQDVTLPQALNLGPSDYIPQMSGRGAWTSVTAPGAPRTTADPDTHYVETALTVANQPAHLQHYVQGPGLLSWWWRAGGPATASMSVGLRYTNTGQVLASLPFLTTGVANIPGGTGWRQEFIEIPPGAAEIRFTYSPTDDSGRGGLDLIRFHATAQQPARGLDRWTSRWETVGEGAWIGQYDSSNGGLDSATHTDIDHNQEASLNTTITGPKTLHFAWKVSSEADFDFLRLYLDGVEAVPAISGEVPWTKVQLSIPPGPHTLRWVYAKDDSVSAGTDSAWLDGVHFMRPDWAIYGVRPLSPTLVALDIRKDPWPGYKLERSTNLTTWTAAATINSPLEQLTTLVAVPAGESRQFFRLSFSPEQAQTVENASFEDPATPAGSFQNNAPGWGPDNDPFTATSFERITGFSFAGPQHVSIDQGFRIFSKTGTVIYPGRTSLTVALGNRPGFISNSNRSGYALTDANGAYYGSSSFNATLTLPVEATIPSGQFRQGYPFSVDVGPGFDSGVPVFVELTSPGTGRSFFDDVRLVSEPQ